MFFMSCSTSPNSRFQLAAPAPAPALASCVCVCFLVVRHAGGLRGAHVFVRCNSVVACFFLTFFTSPRTEAHRLGQQDRHGTSRTPSFGIVPRIFHTETERHSAALGPLRVLTAHRRSTEGTLHTLQVCVSLSRRLHPNVVQEN